MTTSNQEKLNLIKEKFGDKFRIGALKDWKPELEDFVRDNLVKLKMGTYATAFHAIASLENDAVIENVVAFDATVKEPEIVVDKTKAMYVPRKNANYIKHGCFEIVKRVVETGEFCPIYVVGDSGNGKTLSIEQACAQARRELIHVNITCETSEEDLIGTFTLKDGNLEWVDGPVVLAMRRGAVVLCDELDAADVGRIMCLQNILNGGSIYIKKTNEIVVPKHGFTVVATGNTKGTGEGSDRFVGTQVLNEAFLERFNVMFEQDYPTENVERKILARHLTQPEVIERLVKFANTTRKAYKDRASDHCITTRRLVQIAKNYKIFGKELDAVKYAVSRFDDETRDSFMLLYKQFIKTVDSTSIPTTVQDEVDFA